MLKAGRDLERKGQELDMNQEEVGVTVSEARVLGPQEQNGNWKGGLRRAGPLGGSWTPTFPLCGHKPVLYVSFSIAPLRVGSSVPSF